MNYDEIKSKIEECGVAENLGPVGAGWNMSQVPHELATVLAAAVQQNVKTVLEIGTGSGGLAKFLNEKMEFKVVTIEKYFFPAGQQSDGVEYIHGDSHTYDFGGRKFDWVFIDGSHEYDDVKADYERARDHLARKMIALHDTHGSGCVDVEKFWREISQNDGQVRSGYFEVQNDDRDRAPGTGWQILPYVEETEPEPVVQAEPAKEVELTEVPKKKPAPKKSKKEPTAETDSDPEIA